MGRRKLVTWLGLITLAVAGCSDDPLRTTATATPSSASAVRNPAGPKWIPGQYIVRFKDDVRDVPGLVRALVTAPGDSVLFVYEHTIKGFAARLSPRVVEALQGNPHVEGITQDEWGIPDQSGTPWGLDRIDQRSGPLNGTYTPNRSGAGVKIYIIDSGIRRTHREFDWGVRARHAYTAVNDGRGADDCNGHGTHVAGTAAGTNYGVAKQATVLAVRIANCNGSAQVSAALAGMEWVRVNRVLPAVANLSYSWFSRSDIDAAANALIGAGVTFVTSAGNDNADACNYSPKQISAAIVVAGADWNDSRVSTSNWGGCVTLFAPGKDILSAGIGSDTDEWPNSGTSFASPHAAGVAALYLQGDPGATPVKVKNAVHGSSTYGIVMDPKGSPNRLLYAFPVHFAVNMSGPNSYSSGGSYTWEAHPEGGDGSYTYQWFIHYHATGYQQALGTGKTQSVYIAQGSGNFSIDVTSTSAGNTTGASMVVSDDSGSCSGGTIC